MRTLPYIKAWPGGLLKEKKESELSFNDPSAVISTDTVTLGGSIGTFFRFRPLVELTTNFISIAAASPKLLVLCIKM